MTRLLRTQSICIVFVIVVIVFVVCECACVSASIFRSHCLTNAFFVCVIIVSTSPFAFNIYFFILEKESYVYDILFGRFELIVYLFS